MSRLGASGVGQSRFSAATATEVRMHFANATVVEQTIRWETLRFDCLSRLRVLQLQFG